MASHTHGFCWSYSHALARARRTNSCSHVLPLQPKQFLYASDSLAHSCCSYISLSLWVNDVSCSSAEMGVWEFFTLWMSAVWEKSLTRVVLPAHDGQTIANDGVFILSRSYLNNWKILTDTLIFTTLKIFEIHIGVFVLIDSYGIMS